MLKMKLDAEYPGKFEVTTNDAAVLERTVPAGTGYVYEGETETMAWRKGAFEVRRLDTDEVLYSKLEAGEHLVDGKGGPEGKLTQWLAKLAPVAANA
mmetsp:Transcript_7209/g.23928  ORF Transcript_7209/g.23928 Transcript_7209/m.23928 type:complete len:97 (+) Transcript_7209:166-456(+)